MSLFFFLVHCVYVLLLEKSFTLLQYFGGTNFGRTSGGPFYITSYDYDAPIDEYGQWHCPITYFYSQSSLFCFCLYFIFSYLWQK